MHLRIKEEIKAHALRDAPNEACGFIYTTDREIKTFPCKNISNEPLEEFEIDSDDYFEASRQGVIVSIYHSSKGAAFSESDVHHADEWPLPIHLYSLDENTFKIYTPKRYRTDYLGRNFIWGQYDCYTLVKDYYRREYEIYLGEYDCDESYEGAKKKDILLNFAKEGFMSTTNFNDIKNGDILLFEYLGEYHLAIYLGNNQFLHQSLHSQSRLENFDGDWIKRLKMVLKHKSRI